MILFGPILAYGQFVDDFSDGDFTNAPMWFGEDMNFEVDVNNKLHLNAPPVTDVTRLSVASQAINNASWEFTIAMDFNPTSANFAQVFLTASSSDLEGDLAGYFVRIGNTDKEVSLYRQDLDGTKEEIIDGLDDALNTSFVNVRVKVTRTESGEWELSRDLQGGTNYISEGVATDITHASSNFFGVYCKYTSTRSDLFYFDDFIVTGDAFVDSEAPTVFTAELIGDNIIRLVYSEAMDLFSISNIGSYSVSEGIGSPAIVDVINQSEVQLNLAQSLINGVPVELTINNVLDLSGNSLFAIIPFEYILVSDPIVGEVIINEIMADPSPVIGLPEVEYIELYNVSENSFDLENWTLINSTTEKPLSGILPAESFVVICDEEDVNLLTSFGATIGISSFTSLTNVGDSLTLVSSLGDVMDVVSYTDDWYQNSLFSDGGYSLERVNPFLVCSGMQNWSASEGALGGTPGAINSIFSETPDLHPPMITDVFVVNNNELRLELDETILQEDVDNASFAINNGIEVGNVGLISDGVIQLEIIGSVIQSGVLYQLTVSDLQDCAGNILMINNTIEFALPEEVEPGDIVINEILFNPRVDGNDFVEIHNKSNKYLSLKNCKMANVQDGFLGGFDLISSNEKLIFPNEFLVLTESKINVLEEYPNAIEKNIYQVESLPSYNDDEGTVVMLNDFNFIIDSVVYDEDYHFELLDEVGGISLERISVEGDSNDRNNWHSASEPAGFATPGYENSQFVGQVDIQSPFLIEPRMISPDNDGFQDVLTVQFKLSKPGSIANISILDENGRLMGKLANNKLLGTEGIIRWNGIFDDDTKASIGMYILYFELFDLNGKVEKYKEVITVAGKL